MTVRWKKKNKRGTLSNVGQCFKRYSLLFEKIFKEIESVFSFNQKWKMFQNGKIIPTQMKVGGGQW